MQESSAERVSQDAKVALTEFLEEYAIRLGRLAVKYAEHVNRKTIKKEDIVLAKRNLEKQYL